ncbi:nuclear transport factor 2 family protein [Aureimonas ureilytica]|uniref:nuclear transport factor 2 family protein n=1 Tax=Aureimonas ureilytica TaxID=401562 RepID=UPI003CF6E45F
MDDRSSAFIERATGDYAPEVSDAEAAIESLFTAYAAGFDDFDAEAIIACFQFPVTIWQSGRGNVFDDEDELAENVEALLAVFEREEIVQSRFEIVEAAGDGGAAFAVLDWRQEREDGEAALEFRCRYALVRDETGRGWRIALAVND